MEPQAAATPTKGGYVFLSHSGADSEEARVLARAMRSAGIGVWLDVDGGLKPGDRWQAELEKALAATSAFVVYVGARGVVDWIDFEVRLAVDRAARRRDYRVIPVLGPGADTARLPAFLKLFQWVDLSAHGVADPTKLQPLIEALGAPPQARASLLPEGERPFRGLERFTDEHALLFFGRDAQTADLLACLGRDAFLVVVGASGCGKSSLVRTGLIPALRRGRFHDGKTWTQDWRIAIARPGTQPFANLARGLVDLDLAPKAEGRAARAAEFGKLLASGNGGLRDAVSAYAKAGVRSLLVVDQFEELFTLTGDREVRRRYIDNLLGAADMAGDYPIHVVVTLRADFFDRPWEHAQLVERLRTNQYLVPRMSPDGLRAAIEGPLALAGAGADDGLTAALLADAGDEPGALALVEHALDQLWDQRETKQGETKLTHAAYDAMGRLDGALARHANAALAGLPDDAARALARRIFVELTHLGEGAPDTRRIVPLERLRELGESPEPADETIQQLADERLIVVHETTAEVAHEALIRNWPALRAWIAAEREFLRWERRTKDLADEWVRLKKDAEALLRGAALATARQRLAKPPRKPDPLVAEFVSASAKAQQRQGHTQWLRRAALAAAVLIVGYAVYWAVVQGPRRELAKQILAHATTADNENIERRALLAAESLKRARLPEAGRIVREALSRLARVSVRIDTDDIAHPSRFDLVFSPDGKRLGGTVSSEFGRFDASVWDAASGGRLVDFESLYPVQYSHVVIAPDTNHLAIALNSGEIESYFLDVDGPAHVETWILHGVEEIERAGERVANSVTALAYSNDSLWLLTAHADGSIRVSDVNSAREVFRRVVLPGGRCADAVALSASGNVAAVAHRECEGGNFYDAPYSLMIWNTSTGEKIRSWSIPEGDVINSLKFAESIPNGQSDFVAAWSRRDPIGCWDAHTGGTVFDSESHGAGFRSVLWAGFDRDGICVAFLAEEDGLYTESFMHGRKREKLVGWPEVGGYASAEYVHGVLVLTPSMGRVSFGVVGNLFDLGERTDPIEVKSELLSLITNGSGEQLDVAISPAGGLVATAGPAGIRIWTQPGDPSGLSSRELIPELCTRLEQNLDEDEWTNLFPGVPYEKTCPDLP